jgi:hypothetical protein
MRISLLVEEIRKERLQVKFLGTGGLMSTPHVMWQFLSKNSATNENATATL